MTLTAILFGCLFISCICCPATGFACGGVRLPATTGVGRTEWGSVPVTVIKKVAQSFNITPLSTGTSARINPENLRPQNSIAPPLSDLSTIPLLPSDTLSVKGEYGNYYFVEVGNTIKARRGFVEKEKVGRVDIPQDGDIGTSMLYMGYNIPTNPTSYIVKLREHARNNGRYEIGYPVSYAKLGVAEKRSTPITTGKWS